MKAASRSALVTSTREQTLSPDTILAHGVRQREEKNPEPAKLPSTTRRWRPAAATRVRRTRTRRQRTVARARHSDLLEDSGEGCLAHQRFMRESCFGRLSYRSDRVVSQLSPRLCGHTIS